MNQPDATVKSFIQAFAEWNQRANARCNAGLSGSAEDQLAIKTAETEYNENIKRHGSKSVVPQTIAFGDDSMHDPKRESIESVDANEQTAAVHAKHIGMFDFVTNYEYRLVKESDEWRISWFFTEFSGWGLATDLACRSRTGCGCGSFRSFESPWPPT